MNLKQIVKPKGITVIISMILVATFYFLDSVRMGGGAFPQNIFLATLCPPNPCFTCKACGSWTLNNIFNAVNYSSILLFVIANLVISIFFSFNRKRKI